jgi:hypothetical protein
MDIDWEAGELSMRLMNEGSQTITEEIIRIDSLQP